MLGKVSSCRESLHQSLSEFQCVTERRRCAQRRSLQLTFNPFHNYLKVSVMTLSRRQLFTAASAAVCCASGLSHLTAADPPKRTGSPLLKLSLAGYSFNRMFAKRGTLGISISGTAIGNDFCLVEGEARQKQLAECREWIDYASIMGAPAIRIFAGKVPSGDSEDAAIERCAAGINESLKYAATKGVFLALENHGGITATPEQMMKIIDKIETSPWFGVNFDSGNFQTDDPYRDLAKIAPYAVNAQIKASISVNGKKQPADYAKIIEILKNAGYRGFVALEYEEAESPFEAIPKILEQLRPLCS